MADKKPLYIFLHIVKCAGSTVKEHIKNSLNTDEFLFVYNTEPPYLTRYNLEEYILSLTEKQRNNLKIIIGHTIYREIANLFPDREIRYVTFFRNPVSRAISDYNFFRQMLELNKASKEFIDGLKQQFVREGRILTFEEYFLSRRILHNFIFKFLSSFDENIERHKIKPDELGLVKIKEMLSDFYFIGMTEKPEDFSFFYEKLGIEKRFQNANVSQKYFSPEGQDYEETKRIILSKSEFDQEIYNYALKLNNKLKQKPLYVILHIHKCAGTTIRHHVRDNFEPNEILLLYRNINPEVNLLTKRSQIKSYIESLPEERKKSLRVIIGHRAYYGIHELFPDREVRYVVFFRNPAAQTVSHYNFGRKMLIDGINIPRHKKFHYRNGKILSIKEWFDLNEVFQNFNFKFLYNHFFSEEAFSIEDDNSYANAQVTEERFDKVKKILNNFYFIGITENIKDFLFLFHELGIRKFSSFRANKSRSFIPRNEISAIEEYIAPRLGYDLKLYDYALELNKKFRKEHQLSLWAILAVINRRIISRADFHANEFNHYYVKEFYYKIRELYFFVINIPFKISGQLKKHIKPYADFIAWIERTR